MLATLLNLHAYVCVYASPFVNNCETVRAFNATRLKTSAQTQQLTWRIRCASFLPFISQLSEQCTLYLCAIYTLWVAVKKHFISCALASCPAHLFVRLAFFVQFLAHIHIYSLMIVNAALHSLPYPKQIRLSFWNFISFSLLLLGKAYP